MTKVKQMLALWMTLQIMKYHSHYMSKTGTDTVYEEHAILLYQRDRTMVAYGKIYFKA